MHSFNITILQEEEKKSDRHFIVLSRKTMSSVNQTWVHASDMSTDPIVGSFVLKI